MDSLQGRLLIASPKLADPNFFRTVVLLVRHNDEGAMGVVLNRPADLTVDQVWAKVSETDCNTTEHIRAGGLLDRQGTSIVRDEIDQSYLGFVHLAQAFGPAMRMRGSDGLNSAAAWVNILSVYALANWPTFGAYSASQAACLSLSHSLRAELRPGGVKVINVFTGPLDIEWFQTVPPPKVAPRAVANAIVSALKRGLEDVFVGDVAEDIRQRLAANPKAVERELGA